MTFEEFEDEMNRLRGLRFAPAELRTHWEALNDIPMPMLKAAITRAQRTRTEFPTPFELRQDVDAVAHQVRPTEPQEDRGRELAEPVEFAIPHVGHPLRISREWSYDCDVCSDLGMRTFWCGDDRRQPWLCLERCERRNVHGGHEWVRRCECYDRNPTVQRRIASQAKYAASGAQKKTAA